MQYWILFLIIKLLYLLSCLTNQSECIFYFINIINVTQVIIQTLVIWYGNFGSVTDV